jgi:hypothetical protein
MTTLTLSKEDFRLLQLSLIGLRTDKQDRIGQNNYSDVLTLKLVKDLRELEKLVALTFEQDHAQRSLR